MISPWWRRLFAGDTIVPSTIQWMMFDLPLQYLSDWTHPLNPWTSNAFGILWRIAQNHVISIWPCDFVPSGYNAIHVCLHQCFKSEVIGNGHFPYYVICIYSIHTSDTMMTRQSLTYHSQHEQYLWSLVSAFFFKFFACNLTFITIPICHYFQTANHPTHFSNVTSCPITQNICVVNV